MRLLFELDKGDHSLCTHDFVRPSARAILIRDGKIAMVHSLKYDYYKFPGGGIEKGEDPVQAVIRETLEEAGLTVIPGSYLIRDLWRSGRQGCWNCFWKRATLTEREITLRQA